MAVEAFGTEKTMTSGNTAGESTGSNSGTTPYGGQLTLISNNSEVSIGKDGKLNYSNKKDTTITDPTDRHRAKAI